MQAEGWTYIHIWPGPGPNLSKCVNAVEHATLPGRHERGRRAVELSTTQVRVQRPLDALPNAAHLSFCCLLCKLLCLCRPIDLRQGSDMHRGA
jgi:hypothetical protein